MQENFQVSILPDLFHLFSFPCELSILMVSGTIQIGHFFVCLLEQKVCSLHWKLILLRLPDDVGSMNSMLLLGGLPNERDLSEKVLEKINDGFSSSSLQNPRFG